MASDQNFLLNPLYVTPKAWGVKDYNSQKSLDSMACICPWATFQRSVYFLFINVGCLLQHWSKYLVLFLIKLIGNS